MLDDEAKIDLERFDAADVERYDRVTATVDRSSEELAVLVTDLPRKDRQRLDLCIEALRERSELGPRPDSVGRRATFTIQQLVTAQLHDEPLEDWITAVLQDFTEGFGDRSRNARRELPRSGGWRHEERKRQKANGDSPEDET